MCHGICMEVRGQLGEVGPLSTVGPGDRTRQPWEQVPLSAEPSGQVLTLLFETGILAEPRACKFGKLGCLLVSGILMSLFLRVGITGMCWYVQVCTGMFGC